MTTNRSQSLSESRTECSNNTLSGMRFATITLLFAIVLAGCGQRGPLYLPDEPPPASSANQASGPGDTLEQELEEDDDLEEGNLEDEDIDGF